MNLMLYLHGLVWFKFHQSQHRTSLAFGCIWRETKPVQNSNGSNKQTGLGLHWLFVFFCCVWVRRSPAAGLLQSFDWTPYWHFDFFIICAASTWSLKQPPANPQKYFWSISSYVGHTAFIPNGWNGDRERKEVCFDLKEICLRAAKTCLYFVFKKPLRLFCNLTFRTRHAVNFYFALVFHHCANVPNYTECQQPRCVIINCVFMGIYRIILPNEQKSIVRTHSSC